jgi:hypothetical protein
MANSDPRKVILARRAKFVAAALASLATAATCGGKAVVDGPLDQGMGGQTSTGDGAGGLGPHVCLSDVGGTGGGPVPCLEPPQGGSGGMPQPCLGRLPGGGSP